MRQRPLDVLRAGWPHAACGLAALGALLLVLRVGRAEGPQEPGADLGREVPRGSRSGAEVGSTPSRPRDSSSRPLATQARAPSRFSRLSSLHVVNVNTHLSLDTRLYDAAGAVDEQVAARLDTLLGDMREPEQPRIIRLDRRTLQLVYRAAYHFNASTVEVLSAYRAPRRHNADGPHASGRAIDFELPGVPAATLAAYLRSTPRVGVGVYTHRRTQYVHLDTRETSHHWLDASPPGKRWRELSIGPRIMTEHDARYCRAEDWPEGTPP